MSFLHGSLIVRIRELHRTARGAERTLNIG